MAQHTSSGTPNVQQYEIQRDRAWICVPDLREGRGTFRLFVEGDVLYDAMIAAIERAEQDIRLEWASQRPTVTLACQRSDGSASSGSSPEACR